MNNPLEPIDNLTLVEARGSYWFKRDDLFEAYGVNGGKVRTCLALSQGASGLITAGSRMSPQVCIVSYIAKGLKVPCRVHVPSGPDTPELMLAKSNGAEIVRHNPGYNSVIIARAREDAESVGWTNIPFGMECKEAVRQTSKQVQNLPFGKFKRIVVPVGSGMSLAGILEGLVQYEKDVPVLGVVVGANPDKRLGKYAPFFWQMMVRLKKSELDYHTEVVENSFEGVVLDPIYEAKCIPFLEKGDLLWIVGIRKSALA